MGAGGEEHRQPDSGTASEERFRFLLEVIDEGYARFALVAGPDGAPIDMVVLEVNAAYERLLGRHHPVGKRLRDLVPALEQAWVDAVAAVAHLGTAQRFEHHIAALDRWLDVVVSAAEPGAAEVVLIVRDITQRRRAEATLQREERRVRGQNAAFQAAIDGRPLATSLDLLSRMVVDELAGAARTAFYVADAAGTHLHPVWGAGNMPNPYLQRIDKFPIGRDSLACGLAVPTGEAVVTPDVLTAPAWQPWVHLAREHDFRGCWSFPIKTRDQKAVGTFALYFRTARDITASDWSLAEAVTQAAAVILASHAVAQERVRAELALRASEERYAFLVRFSDAVRGLTDPHQVAATACRLVAEELGVERTYWAEVDWTSREFVIGAAFHGPDVPPVEGRFPLDAWEPFSSYHLAGRPVVVNDTQADSRVSAMMKEGYAQIAVGADLATSVMVNGQLRSVLAANQRLPRHWTPEEVALIRGVADRCWAEAERARAEAALRQSEERYRSLFTSIDEGFCLIELVLDANGAIQDLIFREVNPTFARQTGLTDVVGRAVGEVLPSFAADWITHYTHVIETGETIRGENYVRASDRWFTAHFSRVGGAGSRFVAVVFDDVTERKRTAAARQASEASLQVRVAEATSELRALSRRLLLVQEEERRHLARELHDEIGGTLTGLRLQLTAARGKSGVAALADADATLQRLTDLVRQRSMDLRPQTLDVFGLATALETLVRDLERRTGLLVALDLVGLDGDRLAPELEIAAYRIVQEALINVVRHAGVVAASVRLSRDGELALLIRDNGRGFDEAVLPRLNGLRGMQERAALLGGVLTVQSAPGWGTTISAVLPITLPLDPIAGEGDAT